MSKILDKITINGPINVVRLEGKVDNIQKVLYVFFDIHVSTEHQTKCPSFVSDDFISYFIKTIHKAEKTTNHKYDFFVEIDVSDIRTQLPSYVVANRQKYLAEVRKIFRELFQTNGESKKIYKHNTKSNIKSNIKSDHINPQNPNLRLHYFDFRSFYFWDLYDITLSISDTLNNALCHYSLFFSQFDQIKHKLYDIITIVDTTVSKIPFIHIKHKIKRPSVKRSQFDVLIQKIMNQYSHQEIRNKIINDSHIPKMVEREFNNIYDFVERINEHIELINKNFKPEHDKLINNLYYDVFDREQLLDQFVKLILLARNLEISVMNAYAYFVDLYFLRRFLDKDYITHAQVYCGALHSQNYVFALVKNFGFKITHASYSKIPIDKLNKFILDNEYEPEFAQYLFPPILIQCSDVTNFPENFE